VHVAVSGINGGAGSNFYGNGVKEAGSAGLSFNVDNIRLGLGNSTSGFSADQFVGSVADVGYWNCLLTDGEIRALALGAMRPFQIRPGNLRAYFPLDGYGWAGQDYGPFRNVLQVASGETPGLFRQGPPQLNPAPINIPLIILKTPPIVPLPPGEQVSDLYPLPPLQPTQIFTQSPNARNIPAPAGTLMGQACLSE
jgi:hypothetical protein